MPDLGSSILLLISSLLSLVIYKSILLIQIKLIRFCVCFFLMWSVLTLLLILSSDAFVVSFFDWKLSWQRKFSVKEKLQLPIVVVLPLMHLIFTIPYFRTWYLQIIESRLPVIPYDNMLQTYSKPVDMC